MLHFSFLDSFIFNCKVPGKAILIRIYFHNKGPFTVLCELLGFAIIKKTNNKHSFGVCEGVYSQFYVQTLL